MDNNDSFSDLFWFALIMGIVGVVGFVVVSLGAGG